MSNVAPELLAVFAKAATVTEEAGKTGAIIDIEQVVLDRRGLAYMGEYLRTFVGMADPAPTVIWAVDPLALAVIAAASLRLTESWADASDGLLGVRTLANVRSHAGVRPTDRVLIVSGMALTAEEVRETLLFVAGTGATVTALFALVMVDDETRDACIAGGIGTLASCVSPKDVINFKRRKEMFGG